MTNQEMMNILARLDPDAHLQFKVVHTNGDGHREESSITLGSVEDAKVIDGHCAIGAGCEHHFADPSDLAEWMKKHGRGDVPENRGWRKANCIQVHTYSNW
jgi:hypothetical protein